MRNKGKNFNNEDVFQEFTNRLKEGPIANISIKELVKPPKGYAWRIAKRLGYKDVSMVQIRRFYFEIKYISENLKKNKRQKPDESLLTRLYILYPILEYQVKREVIKNKGFVKVIEALLDNLDRYQDSNNFEKAEKFMMALIAYLKEDKDKKKDKEA